MPTNEINGAKGPGTVLHRVHGGPGRAGRGEELRGLRGLVFHSQRAAVQGALPMLGPIFASKRA